MQMKFGVLVFPGSNCDHDTYHVISEVVGEPVVFLWHESEQLENCDAILVPGGFAYGDYLRTGAIAHFAPIMQSVKKFAASGGLVLGICNGFQILAESGLLPGALMRNSGLKYVCKQIYLRTETSDSPFTHLLQRRPGPEDSHRPHGRKLFLRRGHAEATGSPAPYRFSLFDSRRGDYGRRQSQRIAPEYCRHLK